MSGRRGVGRQRALGLTAALVLVSLHVGLQRALPPSAALVGSPPSAVPAALSPAQQELLVPGTDDRLTVLAFFATWCLPCRLELPGLQTAWARHQREGLQVVGVYDAASAPQIDAFVAELGLTFPLVDDATGQWSAAFDVTGLPSVVVVDAQRQVVRRGRGYDPRLIEWVEAQLRRDRNRP